MSKITHICNTIDGINHYSMRYGDKTYMMDEEQFNLIRDHRYNFNLKTDNIYPSYKKHDKVITFLDLLYPKKKDFKFINGNPLDLRIINVECCDIKPMVVKTAKPYYAIVDGDYTIDYCGFKYILDEDQYEKIKSFDHRFVFKLPDDLYPAYSINAKNINYLEFLYGAKCDNTDYTFKNNNIFDIRKFNVLIIDKSFNKLLFENNYKVLSVITEGYLPTMGKSAGQIKNPIYRILTKDNEERLVMYCEKDTLCILCEESIKKIIAFENASNDGNKLVFYKHLNGYIVCSSKSMFIHQIITGCHGNGKGTKEVSVDHIDQDPLNNCFANLRIATRDEQEQNSKGIKEGTKRERSVNAKPLPEELNGIALPKYVVYYKECYNKDKDLWREFFKIEGHPKLEKIWMSSKSGKIDIHEKLDDTLAILQKLDEQNSNTKVTIEPKKTLPPFIRIEESRGKKHLIYDKRLSEDGVEKRITLRMVMPPDYAIDEQLARFEKKIADKYGKKEE